MSSASESEQPEPEPTEEARLGGPTEFDWLTEIAIPLGVFGLLGSLLYYLIELRAALAGEAATGPLRWVVFWFLLAIIGITRIRTKYGGAAVAGYYSVLLAGAVGMFIWVYTGRTGALVGSFSEGGRTLAVIFNWAVVAVIWWAANAVTREATLEENVEVQLEGGIWSLLTEEWQSGEEAQPAEEVDHAQVRPRHPGRLVLWVSLAALVLFAIGQRTIGDEGAHARTAFWCMSLYVLFALALLALTNLSALRMSVRRRGISLSPAVTPTWIVASIIIVIAIVIFSAVMPRSRFPGEVGQRIVQLPAWLSDAHRRGMERGPAEGMGPQGQQPGGQEEGERRRREAGGERRETSEGEAERQGAREGEGQEGERGVGSTGAAGEGGDGGHSMQEGRGRYPASRFSHLASAVMWLLIAATAIAVIVFIVAHRDRIARGLRGLLKIPGYLAALMARLLARLSAWLARLGWRSRSRIAAGELPANPFVNIFDRGLADNLSPAEIIEYVYRAFQTYAAERGYERSPEQTALEFLRSLPAAALLPEKGAERLTRAYVLATYSPREVTEPQVAGALDTWRVMKEYMDQRLRKPQAFS